MAEFDLSEYMKQKEDNGGKPAGEGSLEDFKKVCEKVRHLLNEREAREEVKDEALKRHNRALLGIKTEVAYYIHKVQQILEERGLAGSWFPRWYKSLAEAVYHEGYGFAGFADWMDDEGIFKDSTTCKILGEHIYYDVDGVLQLQEQTISRERYNKLRNTLLNADPKKVKSESYHEIYSQDGKRITIYHDAELAKIGQPAIVFRRYLSNVSSFEAQAAKHTIPAETIPLFKNMIKCGYNVAFTGPVKSAKTTFLTVWQRYEDPQMEGLQIETDPEIPLHLIMPEAPIMQLIPTGSYMKQIMTTAKRSDAAYVILGEARDGEMMHIAVETANMGTRRSKVTLHTTETVDFSFDVADKITRACGGDLGCNMIKVAKSFHYIFNFFSLPKDRKQKRLKGIWEMRYDPESMNITMHRICRYRIQEDDWVFSYDIGPDKQEVGMEEDPEAFLQFDAKLQELAMLMPDEDQHVFEPGFLKLWRRG